MIVEEIILDSDTMMEREITLTILNTRPDLYTDVTFLLTGLGPETPPDFYGEDVVIEVLIDALDPMDIIAFDVWTMAGFYLGLEDFEQTPEGLAAVRSFSYTVNIPESALGPPQMGGAIATEGVLVPEPGTGLLLAGALALVAAAGRRR